MSIESDLPTIDDRALNQTDQKSPARVILEVLLLAVVDFLRITEVHHGSRLILPTTLRILLGPTKYPRLDILQLVEDTRMLH